LRQKDVEFFEHVFPLKVNDTFEELIDITSDDVMCEDLWRTKRQRK